MNKVLIYSGMLTLLYIKNSNTLDKKDYKTMEPFFSDVIVSDSIDEYIHHHKVLRIYPDIVIIDIDNAWEISVDILQNIYQLNSKQMVVVISSEYRKDQLAILMQFKICYSLNKPLQFEDLYQVSFEASKELYDNRLMESKTQMLEQRVIELDKSLQSIKYARETKDQFFANISHEIRTPINAVIGLSHILLDNDLSQKHLDYISKIQTSGNLILSIVNDVLDFSKIEAGKFNIEKIEFNINNVLEDALTMVSFKAYEKGLDLVFDIDNSVPALIKGDPLRLSQVLINLINNAVKFTEKGQITLKVNCIKKDTQEFLEFKVCDTGIGLTKEQISNLFQSFSQADASTSRKYGGTGLGLTISKQLVKLMGGEIYAQSIYGKGSQFIFTIKTEILKKNSYNLSQDLMNKKVLIIDNNPNTKDVLERVLHYFSYITLEALTEEEIVNHIQNNDFDILFIDKELLVKCKDNNLQDNCNAKIVVMHNGIELSDETVINDIDIDAHLVKPFNHQMIFTTILKLFNVERTVELGSKKFKSKKTLQPIAGSHILMVEDNTINQSVVIALLENTEIEITIANNGQEALDIIENLYKSIDLIFMDIEMPIMDGYETIKRLRENSNYDNIPVIALSGNMMSKDIEKTKEAGMVAHLGKPMNVNSFYELLLKYIQSKENLSDRLHNSINQFQTFTKNYNYFATLELSISIQKEVQKDNNEELFKNIKSIEDSLVKHQKVFFVLIRNYSKVFKSFLLASDSFLENGEIKGSTKDELMKILNIKEGIYKMNNDIVVYNFALKTFIDKFRDSVVDLEKLVNSFKFQEVTKLSIRIKEEASAIGSCAVSKAINPIEAISQTQKNHLHNTINIYSKVIKKEF